MAILVIGEHGAAGLDLQTAPVVTAAMEMGEPVHILVAGEACADAARAAAALKGAGKVLVADDPALAHQLAEPMADLIVGLAGDYEAVLAPATANGKNIMPRAAALMDVMQISDIIGIAGPDTFERPVYAGNAIETVRSGDPIKIVTVRPTAFAAVTNGGEAPIEAIAVSVPEGPASFVKAQKRDGHRPELTAASVVVSGGRSMGSGERFEAVLGPLADKLGAAIGASRSAVDAGFAPNDAQIGQTGKVVAPDLYIACGVSGAVQHVAGMKGSKVIVAINTDPDAPIFKIADYGLAADMFEAVPELIESI